MNLQIIHIIIIIIVIILALLLARFVRMAKLVESLAIVGAAAAAGSKISQLLIDSYGCWNRAMKQYKLITQRMGPRDTYEANAILERWYIALYNSPIAKTTDICASDIARKHPATQKMREEFLEKHLFTNETVDAIIDNILNIRADPVLDDSVNGPEVHGEILRFGRFTKVLSAERIQILKQFAGASVGASADDYLLAVAMRYASMAPGGQQWSIPLRVARILVEKYVATLEGFASPFNSQMMRVAESPRGMAQRGLQFCSLFPDLDSKFGSSGNFFAAELAGRVSIINPPYVISIMNDVVTKCLDACERAATNKPNPLPTRMFIVVPKWDDAEFYNRLSGSKYLEKALVHQPFQHFYEDANNSDKHIVASFAGTYFILTVGMPAGGTYLDLEEAIRPREHANSAQYRKRY